MKKIVSWIAAAALLAGTIATPGKSTVAKAASSTTFAALNFSYTSNSVDVETSSDATDLTLKKSKYGSKKNGYSFTKGEGKLYASIDGSPKRKLEWSSSDYTCSVSGKKEKEPVMTAGKKNPWVKNSVPYFEMEVSTSGYKNINFTAYVGASKKGPKSYRLSYAVGSSTTFTTISGTNISLSDNKQMTKISGALPSAAAGQSTVKIRVEIYELKPVSSKYLSLTDDPTSGEAAINHISLSGQTDSSTASTSSTSTTKSSSSTTKKASTSKGTVKAVAFTKKKVTIKKGKTKKLAVKVTVSPNTKANVKAAKKKLTYKSSNKKIATVTKTGKIKAKKAGKVTITVKYSSKIKATCKVVVKKK